MHDAAAVCFDQWMHLDGEYICDLMLALDGILGDFRLLHDCDEEIDVHLCNVITHMCEFALWDHSSLLEVFANHHIYATKNADTGMLTVRELVNRASQHAQLCMSRLIDCLGTKKASAALSENNLL